MSKLKYVFFCVFLIVVNISVVNATSGFLKSSSIVSCNNNYYGQHGSDNHWHIAIANSNGGYSAYGSVISKIPCTVSNTFIINVTSTSKGNKLSYNSVNSASYYKVYRKNTSSYILLDKITTNSFYDSKAITGVTYYYKVVAYKSDNSIIKNSNIFKFTGTKPLKISNITSKSYSYNSNKITITKVSNITGYSIYRSVNNRDFKLIKNTSYLSYVDSYLKTNTNYYYKVRAYKIVNNEKVYGSYSDVVESKPVFSKPSIVFNNSYSSSINININKLNGAHGYYVYRATKLDGAYYYLKSVTSLQVNDSSLISNKYYYYKIRAYRIIDGKKIFSSYSSSIITKTAPKKTAIKASSYDYNAIKINITPVTGAIAYKIYRSVSKSGSYTYIGKTTSTSYIDSSRTINKTYYYKVRSYSIYDKKVLNSNYSDIVSSYSKLKTPSLNLTYNDNGILLMIKPVNGVTKYQIVRSTSLNGVYSRIKTTSLINATDQSFIENKNYYYKVRAYRSVNGKLYYSNYSSCVRIVSPKYYSTGKYIVNKNIVPGLYRVVNNTDSEGIVSRLNALDNSIDAVNSQKQFIGSGYVEIKSTDYAVSIIGVKLYKVVYSKIPINIKSTVDDGIYLISKDINEGTYTVSNIDGIEASIIRLSNVDMMDNSIIEEKKYTENGTIEIMDTDYAVFVVGGTLTKNS